MTLLMLLLLNALLYLMLMLWYRRGLTRLEQSEATAVNETGISVVVAARNEATRLPALIAALAEQNAGGFEFEVLLVNDNSSDDTAAVIAAAAGDKRFRALATSGAKTGKKAAITLGVEQACYPLIAMCDADSVPEQSWLKLLLESFSPQTGLVMGITRLEACDTLFSEIIRTEYAGILGIGLATAALGVPLFGSGSNLAFRRQAFFDAGGYQGIEQIRSGDDTLLIQRISRQTNWEIKPLVSKGSHVLSRAPENFGQLLSQRSRWSSTHLQLPDVRLTLIGLNTYLLITSILVTASFGIFMPAYLAVAAILLALKMLAETGFLLRANRLQGLTVHWRVALTGQFWELLYIPLSPLLGLAGLFNWRRR